MKTSKLRNKILTFALPLTLIPFLLTALAVYYFVIRSYQVQIDEEQNRVLAEAIVDIKREQEAARRDVALIARLSVIAEYLEAVSANSAPEIIKPRESAARVNLQLFFDQSPYYLQLSLVDAQGQERVKLSKLPEANQLKSIKDEDLFRKMLIARNLGSEVQMPVQSVQPGQFASMFTSRVRRDRFAGFVSLHLNTAVFERHLRPVLASHQLSTVLFDDRGLVFARSIAGAEEENFLRTIDFAGEAATLLAEPTLIVSQRKVSSGQRDYLFSILPAEALVNFIEPIAGEKWFLGVLRPRGIMPEQTRSFQAIFFMILVGALGAVIWATARYSHRFTGPLEQMARATTKIARGQFDINLDIKTGDEVEELAGAVKQMADDLKNYQAELIKSEKLAAIGEMASEVSHEIQNRISGLSLWIQYLDAEIEPEDPRREYLQEMKQGLQSFLKLLANLKQLYKAPLLQKVDTDLNELVRDSLPYVEQQIRDEEIELELQLDSDLPAIRCDADKIKSVILNLLINAAEANGNHIVVQTKTSAATQQMSDIGSLERSKAVVLTVEDNGTGITAEELPRIFYPFHSTKAGGSGLGLAIVSNLVTAHGGTIEVQSEAGRGARFTITFQSTDISETLEPED
jgi:signal transduction histidine kinase